MRGGPSCHCTPQSSFYNSSFKVSGAKASTKPLRRILLLSNVLMKVFRSFQFPINTFQLVEKLRIGEGYLMHFK